MDDGKIIELFFERSEQAIEELSGKYGPLCLRLAENILGNGSDAEECVNDAYLGVWNSVPPARPDSLPGYVSRIVRNLAVKRYRSNSAAKRNRSYDSSLDELGDCFPSGDSVEDEIGASELSRALDRFLGGLDRRSRIIFVRRYWHSDSVGDIAAMFRTGKHNVSVILSRTRKKLKKYLKEKGEFR